MTGALGPCSSLIGCRPDSRWPPTAKREELKGLKGLKVDVSPSRAPLAVPCRAVPWYAMLLWALCVTHSLSPFPFTVPLFPFFFSFYFLFYFLLCLCLFLNVSSLPHIHLYFFFNVSSLFSFRARHSVFLTHHWQR